MGDVKSWANQCLCSKCCNIDYSIIFLNKLGAAGNDALLKIIDTQTLLKVICCENIDKRWCLSSLSHQKCFLHGIKRNKNCTGKT